MFSECVGQEKDTGPISLGNHLRHASLCLPRNSMAHSSSSQAGKLRPSIAQS
jgi:hypothetical protein